MTTDEALLREIAALPNGPQKKFLIIKHYGADLRQATKTDIAKLGCETLLALLGGGLPFGEVGNPHPRPKTVANGGCGSAYRE